MPSLVSKSGRYGRIWGSCMGCAPAAAGAAAAGSAAAEATGDLKVLQHALRSEIDESGICPHMTICMSLLHWWSLLTRARRAPAAAAKCDASNSPRTKHKCFIVNGKIDIRKMYLSSRKPSATSNRAPALAPIERGCRCTAQQLLNRDRSRNKLYYDQRWLLATRQACLVKVRNARESVR